MKKHQKVRKDPVESNKLKMIETDLLQS